MNSLIKQACELVLNHKKKTQAVTAVGFDISACSVYIRDQVSLCSICLSVESYNNKFFLIDFVEYQKTAPRKSSKKLRALGNF